MPVNDNKILTKLRSNTLANVLPHPLKIGTPKYKNMFKHNTRRKKHNLDLSVMDVDAE